jgi:predicted aminopeptidase
VDSAGYNNYNCWFVDTPEILNNGQYTGAADFKVYIMWQQDAYRNCLLDHPRFKVVTMNAIWEVPEGETVIYEELT